MENVILLGTSDQFTPKTMRIIHGSMAALFIIQGLFHFYEASTSSWGIIRTVLVAGMTLGGVFYLFIFFKGHSKTSSFTPKVRLTEQSIEFKVAFFSDIINVDWSDIKTIEMKSYQLIFNLSNTTKEVNYSTSSNNSKEIKRSIIEYADTKGIQII